MGFAGLVKVSDKRIVYNFHHITFTVLNYEIWTNKGKYRLKKANISRFWLIFFDFENILRNNYAPFGCNYAPDWCIFLHLVIIKIGEINELKFKDKLQ